MNKNEMIRIHAKKERFCLFPLKEFYVLEARGQEIMKVNLNYSLSQLWN